MYRALRWTRALVCTLSVALLVSACHTRNEHLEPDAAFTPYITAFTSGHISARSPILVRIADAQTWKDTSATAIQKLFELDPEVKGSVSWQDALTLAFQPAEPLEQGKTYRVTFKLSNLIQVPKGFDEFQFEVTTYMQDIDLRVSDLQSISPTDLKWQRVHIAVYTSDQADPVDLEKCITARQNNRALKLAWEHEPNGNFHRAVADSVLRAEAPGIVTFIWDGSAIGSSAKGEKTFEVPAIGDLRLISTETFSEGEQYARLLFSDPLDPDQELEGLAGIDGAESVRLNVDGNHLLLYPQQRLSGEQHGFVAAGLKNVNGRVLGKDITIDLTFEEVKPNVRLVGDGTILPSTDGLLFPFEAVNLNAVDVKIIRIYADNVPQFLQVNALSGERELARVARPVLKQRVALSGKDKPAQGRWNRYYLDLDKLIKAEPGAIYRVILGFRKAYSTYPCADASPEPALTRNQPEEEDDESEWDTPDRGYYYEDYEYWEEGEDYDYRKRDEPCNASYFRNKGSVAQRNILASDLGMIAKRGNDGSLVVAISDLRTTEPMSGVKVNVLDLQRRSLGELVTDGRGLITVPAAKHKPFLLIASKGPQRGYLKLDDGSALNISEYDVQGETVEKGIKGMLYGERGVWRPGDSLYLSFILQDAEKKLPKDHPVVLELTDPQGRLDQRMVRTTGVNGTYSFRCATDPDAPTGTWNALVKVGGTSFHKPIRIETVKPNRLKIQLDLGGDRLVGTGERKVQLQSNWLHGAPARELKARVTVALTRSYAAFKGYEKYSFNDLNTEVNSDETTVFDGALDANGHTEFPFEIKMNQHAPAAVSANIVTRVFEAGGDASMDRTDATYYPYSAYAGFLFPEATSYWGSYLTDTTYNVTTVALDGNGKPLPSHKLRAQVYKVSYSWWWDGDMEGPSSYMNAPSSRIMIDQELTTDPKGKARFNFRINKPDWGRFIMRLSDPVSGHASAREIYLDWPGYEGRSRRQNEKEAVMLTFNSDKETYAPGETCTLTIPSSGSGRAFISLETGTRVIDADWIEVKGKETKYSFPITGDMSPNIYAYVTLVQPHSKTQNDLPIRLYGVIPIKVEDPVTHLHPAIAMAKEIKTDEPFNVEVSEANGEAMTYTLAIVDEGLLDLTRFKTPDPWNHFYAREALGVRTWDLYDQVIGAYGQQLQRVLAIGGSDEADPSKAARANRFKPVVRFVGPLKLAKGAKARHQFMISNYVGSVRVMVVANDGDRAYGNAEKAVPVKKPLMLLATLPRVVGPGETVDLPVTVFAMDPKVKNVQLKLEANDFFQLDGPAMQTLTFKTTGDQVAVFKVRMVERIGVGKVKLIAEGAGERATESIEIQVRQPNLPQTDFSEAVVEAGKNWESTPAPVGILGTNTAYLEVSAIPPVDLGRRLQYLIDYPHGCVEQTTSKAFPQLFIADVMDVDARTTQAMRANVEAGLRRLKFFQLPGGGFTYWPGNSDVSDWSSIYVGHFMIEAERKGFALPAGMKQGWLNYARGEARKWTPRGYSEGWSDENDELLQAYRLYVLALSKNADAGAMNHLRTTPGLGERAKWMLAATFALNNRKDVAKEMVKGLSTTVSPYSEMAWTYGSGLRDEGIIAEALMLMDDKATAAVVIKRMAEELSADHWYSTQTTCWSLLAVSHFAISNTLGKGMDFTISVNGKIENRHSNKSVVRVELPTPDGKKKVMLTNSGKNLLYVRTVRTGTPMPGAEHPASNGLAIDVRYQRMNGDWMDPTTLDQGTDFQAVVTIQHPGIRGWYQELALTQVFPSGWEIRNSRLEGTENAQQNSYFEYQDIRDDRVMTYFDLRAHAQVTYRVFLNAAYAGRFYMPPTSCEAMYDNTVNARSSGSWVNVVKPGSPTASK